MGTDYEADIVKCLDTLRSGGIILYPTDTIWGVGCDASNNSAIQKIINLKNRPDIKAMILLVASKEMLLKYIEYPGEKIFEYLSEQKKPTTVIYKAKDEYDMLSNNGTIALRITDDPFCNSLIKQFHKPIVSTSANISGESSPENFKQVSDKIKSGVDFIVQHRQDDHSKVNPSAIIRMNQNNTIEILRN
ncbi:MAG: threonylcarbamoyl-AMP synthase [Chitinophagaceae bacterium]|nr:threonylcarbamoyl-AMP synthase [Chitinophagaceae bacterium]